MITKYDLEHMGWEKKELIVSEAIVRRAALLPDPFMLKGSMITRQYFTEPMERNVADLDWVYLGEIEDAESANQIFSDWMTKITLMDVKDDILFTDFRKNQFWRRIDYAMSDDFPTINTDIEYQFGDITEELSVDISFHLEMPVKPVPLLYKPLYGEPFKVNFTPPLSVQIAWKLHQTVMRPRFKDLTDLFHLLQHPYYTQAACNDTLLVLKQEWTRDHYINPEQMRNLLKGDLDWIYKKIEADYDWRHQNDRTFLSFKSFSSKLSAVLKKAGFCEDLFYELYEKH